MRVLVTGAAGFIGGHLCAHLARQGMRVRALTRTRSQIPLELRSHTTWVAIEDLASPYDADALLRDVDAVVHLAARVHRMVDCPADGHDDYRRVNVDATAQLARAAVARGVRRFVLLSSVKVHGERSPASPDGALRTWCEQDPPQPADAYALSKLAAERALMELCGATDMSYTIVRVPLVYGPGVSANFLRLMDAVARRWPLPLASVDNRRSFAYVGNVVSGLSRALDAKAAGNEVFLLSDGEDLSTPELVRRLAKAMNRRAALLPLPPALLATLAGLAGKRAFVERLTGSLVIDSSKIRQALAWTPPHSVDAGLQATADWFLDLARKPDAGSHGVKLGA